MAGGKISEALIHGITVRESANDGSDFTNPTADYRRLFLGEDGQLHVKDSAGTVTDIGASSGSVATDAIWDAAGDLAVGSGSNTAAKLTIGATNGMVVSRVSGAVAWGFPGLRTARARRTSGDVSMNSTTWANFDTGLDLVIAAASGDVLLVDVSGHYNSEAVGGILDAATIVSGSPVNYISGGAGGASNRGVLGWYGPGASASVGAAVQYVVQSGDISGGSVTLRLRYRTTSAAVKTMNATSDIPFQWSVVNLGQ